MLDACRLVNVSPNIKAASKSHKHFHQFLSLLFPVVAVRIFCLFSCTRRRIWRKSGIFVGATLHSLKCPTHTDSLSSSTLPNLLVIPEDSMLAIISYKVRTKHKSQREMKELHGWSQVIYLNHFEILTINKNNFLFHFHLFVNLDRLWDKNRASTEWLSVCLRIQQFRISEWNFF